MAEKDMSAKLIKEPLTKTVKKAGTYHEEVIEEPVGDIIDQLAEGVENLPESTLSGFGKQSSPANSKLHTTEIKQGATGFASFADTQGNKEDIGYIENPDDVMEEVITTGKANADKIYKKGIEVELRFIESSYKDLPNDWRDIAAIRKAIIATIADNIGVTKDIVDQLI